MSTLLGRAVANRLQVSVGLVAVCMVACSMARGAEIAPASVSPAFNPGDVLSVAAEQTRLMLGDTVLATPAKGQRLVVAETRGKWIGTHLDIGGQTKSGWIHVADVERAPGVQAYEALRPIAAAAPISVACPVAYESTWDAFLVGRYLRYETDPNLHVWEPWRWR